jgi:hypothetical protein
MRATTTNGALARFPLVSTVPTRSYSNTNTSGSAVSCMALRLTASNRTGSVSRLSRVEARNASRPSYRFGWPGGANGDSTTTSSVQSSPPGRRRRLFSRMSNMANS